MSDALAVAPAEPGVEPNPVTLDPGHPFEQIGAIAPGEPGAPADDTDGRTGRGWTAYEIGVLLTETMVDTSPDRIAKMVRRTVDGCRCKIADLTTHPDTCPPSSAERLALMIDRDPPPARRRTSHSRRDRDQTESQFETISQRLSAISDHLVDMTRVVYYLLAHDTLDPEMGMDVSEVKHMLGYKATLRLDRMIKHVQGYRQRMAGLVEAETAAGDVIPAGTFMVWGDDGPEPADTPRPEPTPLEELAAAVEAKADDDAVDALADHETTAPADQRPHRECTTRMGVTYIRGMPYILEDPPAPADELAAGGSDGDGPLFAMAFDGVITAPAPVVTGPGGDYVYPWPAGGGR